MEVPQNRVDFLSPAEFTTGGARISGTPKIWQISQSWLDAATIKEHSQSHYFQRIVDWGNWNNWTLGAAVYDDQG